MTHTTQIHYTDFYRALPAARDIYEKYADEYIDGHSQWLGRWIRRAERHCYDPSQMKQEMANKLIAKLAQEILVSPYDHAPFENTPVKMPVLMQGMLFPNWMIEDILTSIGYEDKLQYVKPHALMLEMLVWSNNLTSPPTSKALVPLQPSGALITVNQTSYLDSNLMVSLNSNPDLVYIKLMAYRELMKKAFKVMMLKAAKREVKSQTRQIVSFGQEQKELLANERVQIAKQQTKHAHTVAKQHEEIAQLREATQNTMKAHYEDLIAQITREEERLKRLQQECKNKEAEIQSVKVAQSNLRV